MPAITFEKLKSDSHPDATVVQLTDANIKPILQLWLLLTTNSKFLAQLANPTTLSTVAEDLGIDPSVIKQFLAQVPGHAANLSDIQGVFQKLAQDDDYQGYCPSSMDVITGL